MSELTTVTPEQREATIETIARAMAGRRADVWRHTDGIDSRCQPGWEDHREKAERALDALLADGWFPLGDPNKPVLKHVRFGFMVGGHVDDEGWCRLEVPAEAPTLRGPAEAEHVRKAVASWSARLAEYDESQRATDDRITNGIGAIR